MAMSAHFGHVGRPFRSCRPASRIPPPMRPRGLCHRAPVPAGRAEMGGRHRPKQAADPVRSVHDEPLAAPIAAAAAWWACRRAVQATAPPTHRQGSASRLGVSNIAVNRFPVRSHGARPIARRALGHRQDLYRGQQLPGAGLLEDASALAQGLPDSWRGRGGGRGGPAPRALRAAGPRLRGHTGPRGGRRPPPRACSPRRSPRP